MNTNSMGFLQHRLFLTAALTQQRHLSETVLEYCSRITMLNTEIVMNRD